MALRMAVYPLAYRFYKSHSESKRDKLHVHSCAYVSQNRSRTVEYIKLDMYTGAERVRERARARARERERERGRQAGKHTAYRKQTGRERPRNARSAEQNSNSNLNDHSAALLR